MKTEINFPKALEEVWNWKEKSGEKLNKEKNLLNFLKNESEKTIKRLNLKKTGAEELLKK